MAERVSGLTETMRYLQYLTPFLLLLAACSANAKSPDLTPATVIPDKKPNTNELIGFLYNGSSETTLHVLNYTDHETLDTETIKMLVAVMLAIGNEENELNMSDKWGNSVTAEAGFRKNLKNVYFYFVEEHHPKSFTVGLPPDQRWPGLTWAEDNSPTVASSILTKNKSPSLTDLTLVDLSTAVEVCQAFLKPKTATVSFAELTPSPSFVHYLIHGDFPEQEGLCNAVGDRLARVMNPNLSVGLQTERWPIETTIQYKWPPRAMQYEKMLVGRHVLVK